MSARLIQVIVTDIERRGKGEDMRDPIRRITQYWSTDGELLAEAPDHWVAPPSGSAGGSQ